MTPSSVELAKTSTLVGVFGQDWTPSTGTLRLMTTGAFALAAPVGHDRPGLRALRDGGLQRGYCLASTVGTVSAALGLLGLETIALGT
jgi:hypothetical protein